MNIIELVLFAGIAGIIIIGSHAIGHKIGINPWLVGGVVAPLVIVALIFLHRFTSRNSFPKCENGTCGPDDYKGVGYDGNGFIVECRCGQKYILSKRTFQAIDSNGKPRPYMKKKFNRWVNDASLMLPHQP